MMDQTAHCMSNLYDLTCCCRGMGSATVSHPEVADDKCSAALDIPKVASLLPNFAHLNRHHTECPGRYAKHELQMQFTEASQSNVLVKVGQS